ncbi:hypothetical protein M0657_009948 [Pyricularia oryzae]|uniref:Uncharacterized protein n=1 Tax=Pyricularia oryzae TaxID=318829 RepID=A0A4P7ND32_PYROR|nr:hypothetical protein MCOR11_001381 [Pyricularia oryzae]KAI7913604.1 hypothetical protein M0657_009948 [Pyricularia oryzae]KAI7926697.1 hypothetical protein M9X92_002711 [Pyricularia oryzae]QBZ59616.1 hypothetical protein PoMZ_04578 [Pyricularia oryzae]
MNYGTNNERSPRGTDMLTSVFPSGSESELVSKASAALTRRPCTLSLLTVLWTEILTKLWKILAVGESKIAMVSSFERQKRTDWRLAKVVMDETGCDLCGGEH